MKHAFLIMAHNNWSQLKKLIQTLDAENHDIYLHIDKKSKDFDQNDFQDITQKSHLYFFQKHAVYWGGFSQIETELTLFEEAHKIGYDYYHVISGADLPLKNNQEIALFFEENKGSQFILYDEKGLKSDPEITRRTKYYHFLQNYRRRYGQKWKNAIFTFLERVSLVLQIVVHVDRTKDLDWTIKYGSNWVSITDELVKEILLHKTKIKKVFSWTNCADELFVQTIAYNCGFKDQIYQPAEGQTANLRFIDWTRGKNGNPYTFRKEDLDILFPESGDNVNLFARKFSETVDEEIIDGVIQKIMN